MALVLGSGLQGELERLLAVDDVRVLDLLFLDELQRHGRVDLLEPARREQPGSQNQRDHGDTDPDPAAGGPTLHGHSSGAASPVLPARASSHQQATGRRAPLIRASGSANGRLNSSVPALRCGRNAAGWRPATRANTK